MSYVSSRFERIAPNGERFTPHCYNDGLYQVANPALGQKKHHAVRQIAIRGEEIAGYLERGFIRGCAGNLAGKST